MISVDAVRAIIIQDIAPLPPKLVSIDQAYGLVLAAPVVAPISLPSFDNAAMDGYAIRATETDTATPDAPVHLAIAGQVAAGYPPGAALRAGKAVRIMTGAPIPAGADTVVPFEEVTSASDGASGHPETIAVSRPVHSAENVRRAGEDVVAGTPVLNAGHVLRAVDLGLIAALGIDRVNVVPRPRVAILSTGTELAPPGESLAAGQIYDANGPLLAALVAGTGAVPVPLGVVPDTSEAILSRLRSSPSVDVILCSGGISTGDFDLVKRVLSGHGNLITWQVRMRPGKPLAFGEFGGVPLIGLPGNPAAAAVSFEVFVRPLLAKMASNPANLPLEIPTILMAPISNPRHLRSYARATVRRGYLGIPEAHPATDQNTSHLSALATANALVIVPEEVGLATPGMRLNALILDRDPAYVLALLGSASTGAGDYPSGETQ